MTASKSTQLVYYRNVARYLHLQLQSASSQPLVYCVQQSNLQEERKYKLNDDTITQGFSAIGSWEGYKCIIYYISFENRFNAFLVMLKFHIHHTAGSLCNCLVGSLRSMRSLSFLQCVCMCTSAAVQISFDYH